MTISNFLRRFRLPVYRERDDLRDTLALVLIERNQARIKEESAVSRATYAERKAVRLEEALEEQRASFEERFSALESSFFPMMDELLKTHSVSRAEKRREISNRLKAAIVECFPDAGDNGNPDTNVVQLYPIAPAKGADR